MGALVLTKPARTGTVSAGAAVGSTDTISRDKLGTRGVYLEILNGNASANPVTISDDSINVYSGAPAAPISVSIAAGTSQTFKIVPDQANKTSGNVTITNGTTATVTYKMTPLD